MSKTLFSEVKKALISLQPKGIQGHALQRITNLTAFVSGMIDKQSCHLNALGSGLEQDINDASRETAAKRFVESDKTTYKLHYLPYFRQLLLSVIGNLGSEGLVLIIDGSQMGTSHVALMVSLFYKNRSIPIFWLVKKGKKGHFPTDMHLDIVKEVADIVQAIVPKKLPITLLGDGEFDSVELQSLCRDTLHWNYVFRTASDTVLYENDDPFKPKSIVLDNYRGQLDKNDTFVFIPNLAFSLQKYEDVHFLYWHDKKLYKDPLYLVASFDDPFDIMFYYKKRFAIETLFKDLKSRGFNLHKNRLKKDKALFNLIIIAALGFCLIISFGQKNQDNPLIIKVLRIHKIEKNEKSIFFFGVKFLKYLLKYDIKFHFDFAVF
jgi:hypothetical protein